MGATRTFVITSALVALLMPAAAFAQARSGPPIAYISLQRILTEAEDAKMASKELEVLRDAKAKELTTKKLALDATKLQIANAGGMFSTSKREQLKVVEKQQEAELQQANQQAQTEFQELQRKLQSRLRDELNTIVTTLASQRGIQYVLNQDAAIVLAPTAANVTDEVLGRLNAAAAQRAGTDKPAADKAAAAKKP